VSSGRVASVSSRRLRSPHRDHDRVRRRPPPAPSRPSGRRQDVEDHVGSKVCQSTRRAPRDAMKRHRAVHVGIVRIDHDPERSPSSSLPPGVRSDHRDQGVSGPSARDLTAASTSSRCWRSSAGPRRRASPPGTKPPRRGRDQRHRHPQVHRVRAGVRTSTTIQSIAIMVASVREADQHQAPTVETPPRACYSTHTRTVASSAST